MFIQYVAVKYAHDPPQIRYFDRGVCYPYQLEETLPKWACGAKIPSATTDRECCYEDLLREQAEIVSDADCSDVALPLLPLPLVFGVALINPAKAVDFLGKEALCEDLL